MTDSPLVAAHWFDGLRSQPQRVLVGLAPSPEGPALTLHPLQGGGASQHFRHRDVDWPEAWNPRRPQALLTVDLGDAGSLQIDDAPAWHAALQAAGHRPGLAQRMQTRWPAFAAVLVVAAVGLTLFYRYGTPWLATQLTRQVPLGWETQLSESVLRQMDDGTLRPSKLPAARQAALRARFEALTAQAPATLQRYRGYAPRYTLSFRSGMGANAFALPGGTVVVTDALVEAARQQPQGDEALLGVLAHEMGHVVHRHTTRIVVEQGVLNIGLGMALGDVSVLLSTGSSLLTGLAYRRNHEREADCFAIALMGHARLPTAPMADLLIAISHDAEAAEAPQAKGGAEAPAPSASRAAGHAPATGKPQDAGLWSLLSSHPDTVGRAEALRAGRAPHCAAP